MQLLYTAAPYRANTIIQLQHNIHQASLMAQFYWLKGFVVICPHLNTANFDGLIPDADFLKAALLLQAQCTHSAFHPDWTTSIGCMDEYKNAKNLNHTIHFTNMERVDRMIQNHFFTKKHIDDLWKG